MMVLVVASTGLSTDGLNTPDSVFQLLELPGHTAEQDLGCVQQNPFPWDFRGI
jgi:hypothetical protein